MELEEEEDEEEDDNGQIPLLFVDVNLGEGQSDRIVLYDGDQPAELANNFAIKHKLDQAMKVKLTELLT